MDLNRVFKVVGSKLYCLGIGGVTDLNNIKLTDLSLQEVLSGGGDKNEKGGLHDKDPRVLEESGG